jgi:hypothetical protein
MGAGSRLNAGLGNFLNAASLSVLPKASRIISRVLLAILVSNPLGGCNNTLEIL